MFSSIHLLVHKPLVLLLVCFRTTTNCFNQEDSKGSHSFKRYKKVLFLVKFFIALKKSYCVGLTSNLEKTSDSYQNFEGSPNKVFPKKRSR